MLHIILISKIYHDSYPINNEGCLRYKCFDMSEIAYNALDMSYKANKKNALTVSSETEAFEFGEGVSHLVGDNTKCNCNMCIYKYHMLRLHTKNSKISIKSDYGVLYFLGIACSENGCLKKYIKYTLQFIEILLSGDIFHLSNKYISHGGFDTEGNYINYACDNDCLDAYEKCWNDYDILKRD